MELQRKEIPKPRNFVKEKKSKHEIAAPEFDLHRKVSAQQTRNVDYDILTLQTETAKRHIEFAIRNRIPKIVFIHGVGKEFESRVGFLIGRYDNIAFQEGIKIWSRCNRSFIKQSAM
jgi:hypothetical protein